ncbi:MAG: transcription antitermination factor NusB [Clostridia bacterium]|nr:transcription antitermination factor NusB [Clostridia bacterium]
MSRKTAREQVFKLIYERCVEGEPNSFSLDLTLEKCDDDDALFIRKLYAGINEKYAYLQRIIERYSKGFTFERIFKIDCGLLMLASYEILYIDDIPVAASVNEALELAKKYSTDKSVSFINGVLASVASNKEKLLKEEFENDEPTEDN